MISLNLLRRVTDEDLLRLSERNPGYQFERMSDGRLVVSPTGGESGRLSMEVSLQLGVWNRNAHLGVVFDSSTGFNLPDGSCRSPDASWVRRERWEALSRAQRKGFPPLCPDAVFEVRSESDSLADMRAIIEIYMANGAQLATLVDAESRAVEVHRLGQEPERHENVESVSLDPELPGFALELGSVFWE